MWILNYKKKIPQRFAESHKGSYGTVLVLCGSKEMPGASRLVSRGAYAAGGGLVKKSFLKTDIPEVIVKVVNERYIFERFIF